MVDPTLEAKDSPEDFEVLAIMSRGEDTDHTTVQHGLGHLGLQQADVPPGPGGRYIV